MFNGRGVTKGSEPRTRDETLAMATLFILQGGSFVVLEPSGAEVGEREVNTKVTTGYLLVVLGDNDNSCPKDFKSILGSVGVDDDEGKTSFLLSQMEGKVMSEVITFEKEKCTPFHLDGGVVVAV